MPTSISFLSGTKLEQITFDTASNVKPTYASEVTDHPVEAGSPVSDNTRALPVGLSMEALLVDNPLSKAGGGTGIAAKKGRAADVLSELIYLKDKGVRVNLHAAIGDFSNLAITSIAPNADKIKGAIRLAIAFKRIQVVASETVNVSVASNRGAQKKQDLGKLTGKEQPNTEPLKSNFAKMLDSDVTGKVIDSIGSLF